MPWGRGGASQQLAEKRQAEEGLWFLGVGCLQRSWLLRTDSTGAALAEPGFGEEVSVHLVPGVLSSWSKVPGLQQRDCSLGGRGRSQLLLVLFVTREVG